MTTVAEHTYEETLLPEKANILDLGCRGFLFARHMQSLGHKVVCVDLDSDVEFMGGTEYGTITAAVIADNSAAIMVPYEKTKDPQATKVTPGKITGNWAQTTTVSKLTRLYGLKMWDLIKIDIEGSEYEVIMSLTEPPAKQLSIEFHLHTGIYGDAQVKEMEDKLLSLGYFPVKHDKYPAHGLSPNYWDSLWILK